MIVEVGPFKNWISFETKRLRLSLQAGMYKEFYYFNSKLPQLKNKYRFAFYIGELIVVIKESK